uniref:Uncharacterized protein n=1 Tax=Trypanosoma vivax (strain Y486) TaxID=1055687 RepID=G0UBF6_TRYVY|nr:conserved hypothetical protein, fragment [Trypanosoma vivax Y486]
MKVASRGPIVRWALRRPTTGVVVSRDDWRGGRSLEEEEKAAGLFVRLREAFHNLYHVVSRAEEEQGAFHITDVVLPVPYGIAACEQSLFPQLTPLDRDLYREFAEKHHLEFLFSDSLSPPLYGSLEFYRPLVVKPDHLQLAVLHDPNSFTSLKSDLFMMQERRPVQAGEMDYTARVREPCVYNVSERFVEKMEPVLKAHSGPYTVVLSFFLPDGASPLVMLRESFSLHYASFQDMYCVS